MLTKTVINQKDKISQSNHILKSNTIFGFWIYMMSDCIIFATLFATYAVMVNNTADGPIGKDFFKIPFVLIETVFLLISSLTYGMAVISMSSKSKDNVNRWLFLTFLLGLSFVLMEIYEFNHLITKNISPRNSGFLSCFFTLVGTHGLHVICGLIWIMVLIFQITQKGLTTTNCTRIMCLSLFWHFLDIVWICLYTIVYLMGVI
ncbi:cytochrome o ubiquinol oxidase subunit III [Candidatus Ishikawella capsulata]|uniref:Cytochrome bo(3) ubiquinol oxidase subunit 3 n=1 Tax=Candidatus Ishikawaella capsulata Mpkobe TaxID=476281 RepID=C5WCZ6_9ENTR|nr:cytochrome o ubiquinol oxidase subunit III [Candidatus Ishikawaella capsulata]BAH83202.1 cytochrome o ubiquinol oxidase subunit III [Candidatus Ishikawaella capsulata Mpkobe]